MSVSGGGLFELGTDGPTRVLVGVDGTASSLRAGAYAAGLSRREGAHLLVLYVVNTPGAVATMAEAAVALAQTQHGLAEELRTTVQTESARLGISAEFAVRRGNPYRELVRLAHERRVDAIVVGGSMRAGHRFVGSLAGRLIRDAAWPVTVVP